VVRPNLVQNDLPEITTKRPGQSESHQNWPTICFNHNKCTVLLLKENR